MRLLLDCDPGFGVPGANIDDVIALALAAARPDLSLQLVTTVRGNTAAGQGAQIARGLLVTCGRTDVRVVGGAERPLGPAVRAVVERTDRTRHPLARELWSGIEHLRPLAAGAPADEPSPRGSGHSPKDAARAIVELAHAHPGEVVVVAIGPLTNLASAIRIDPTLPSLLRRVVVMGGALHLPDHAVETNVGLDPLAAAEVLGSGAPTTLVPMDATVTTMLTPSDLQRFCSVDGTVGRLLEPGLLPWLRFSERTRGIPGSWLHDVVAVALLTDPAVATSRPARVRVAADGRLSAGSGAWVDLVTSVDNDRLLGLVADALAAPAGPTTTTHGSTPKETPAWS